jgi:hypothetical protein
LKQIAGITIAIELKGGVKPKRIKKNRMYAGMLDLHVSSLSTKFTQQRGM